MSLRAIAVAASFITVGLDACPLRGDPIDPESTSTLAGARSTAFTRDLSTDRPDITESPYTVEKGRTQVEIEVAAYGLARSRGIDVTSTGLAAFLIKRGIHHRMDLQVGTSQVFRRTDFDFDPVLEPGRNDLSDDTGPGDLVIRLKWNVWGDDGGTTAFALMPYLDLPTSPDSPGTAVEGGLIAPLAIEGPLGFGFGVMGEVDWFDVEGERWTEWLTTATASRDIAGGLAGFVELAGTFRVPDEGEWLGLFNTGLTFAVTPNTQLDAGIRLGITDPAPEYEGFLGFSFRR